MASFNLILMNAIKRISSAKMVAADAQIVCGGQLENRNICVDFAADINCAFCERNFYTYDLLMNHLRTSREDYVVVNLGKTSIIHSCWKKSTIHRYTIFKILLQKEFRATSTWVWCDSRNNQRWFRRAPLQFVADLPVVVKRASLSSGTFVSNATTVIFHTVIMTS